MSKLNLNDGWYRAPHESYDLAAVQKKHPGCDNVWVYVRDGKAVGLWYAGGGYGGPYAADAKGLEGQLASVQSDCGISFDEKLAGFIPDRQWVKLPPKTSPNAELFGRLNAGWGYRLEQSDWIWVQDGKATAFWSGPAQPAEEPNAGNRAQYEEFWNSADRVAALHQLLNLPHRPAMSGLVLPGLALATVLIGGTVKAWRERAQVAKFQKEQHRVLK